MLAFQKNLLAIFLYKYNPSIDIYDKVTQYPILRLNTNRDRDSLLFDTERGSFYRINNPARASGTLSLLQWQKGRYLLWIGPVPKSVDADELRKQISLAIEDANNYLFR